MNTAVTGDVVMTGEGDDLHGEIEFTNHEETRDLTVRKLIEGSGGSSQKFNFSAELAGVKANKDYEIVISPYGREGRRYGFSFAMDLEEAGVDVPSGSASAFNFSFDRYDDDVIGHLSSNGIEITAISVISNYDGDTYDDAYTVICAGVLQFNMYHRVDEDYTDPESWELDFYDMNGELIDGLEKVALKDTDSITDTDLADIDWSERETRTTVRSGSAGSDGTATLRTTFTLGGGDSWTISGLPVGTRIVKVDEDIEDLPFSNSWRFAREDMEGVEMSTDLDAAPENIVITSGSTNLQLICTNVENAKNFIVKKQVTGNMGSRDKKFPFETKITGLRANTQYVAFITADPTLAEEDVEEDRLIKYTSDSSGELLAQYSLCHGQYWKIVGLPVGAVTETKEIASLLTAYTYDWQYQYMDSAGNVTTVESDNFTSDTDNVTINDNVNDPTVTCELTRDQDDSTLVWINDRETVVPTGLIDNLWTTMLPLAAGVAAIAFGLYMRKRNNETGEEA